MVLKNNCILSALLVCVLFSATYGLFGYYFGWVDDVLMNNYFQGIPLHQPIDHAIGIHFLLAQLYRNLYHFFPDIPWYGIMFGLWIFLATVNFCVFFLNQFSEYFSNSRWVVVSFIVVIYVLVWVENVYLINFSRVALLLMGTSFLNIHRLIRIHPYSRATLWGLFYYSFTFMIGLLTRMELTFILLPCMGVYAFWGIKQKYDSIKVISIILVMLLSYKGVEYSFFEKDNKEKNAVSHTLNLIDGLNTYNTDISSLQKDIKTRALFNYYIPDTTIIDPNYLESLGPGSPFNLIGLKHIKRNLLSEYDKATAFPKEYHAPLNWFWKSVSFTVFNFLLLFVSIFRGVRKELRWGLIFFQMLFGATFFFSIFLITVLSKMEDRVLNPAFIIFSLAHLVIWFELHKSWIKSLRVKAIISLLLLPMVILSLFRINGYMIISKQEKEEMELKKAVLNELNNGFSDKMIFYDIWAMTLLHQAPLKPVHLDPKNIHSCYGEYWCNFQSGHREYLESLCGKTDFISFYKCLYTKRDKVIFVFSKKYRKELIELYAETMYGEKIVFKEIMPSANLKNIHYSFVWAYNDFGYYVFDKSFSDAN